MPPHRSRVVKGGKPGKSAAVALPYDRHQANAVPFTLQKKLGQHLLKSPEVLGKIVNAANIRSTDKVLEIGPGTGNLTFRLLTAARRVTAFDIDERMVLQLKKKILARSLTNLDVRCGDALREDLGHFDVLVANMPYQISAPFVFKLIAHRQPWRCAVLMFQKEFCQRLLAQPGEKFYSRLSVNVQLFCDVERVINVSAGCFNPPPQVDSMVVRLQPKVRRAKVHFREWDGLLRLVFNRRSRTLRANLSSKTVRDLLAENLKTVCAKLQVPRPSESIPQLVEKALREAELTDARASTTSLLEFHRLLVAMHRSMLYFRNVNNHPLLPKEDAEAEGLDEMRDALPTEDFVLEQLAAGDDMTKETD